MSDDVYVGPSGKDSNCGCPTPSDEDLKWLSERLETAADELPRQIIGKSGKLVPLIYNPRLEGPPGLEHSWNPGEHFTDYCTKYFAETAIIILHLSL